MTFVVKSSSMHDYQTWLAAAQESPQQLSFDTYNHLAQPSKNNPTATYSDVVGGLYDGVMTKYMPGMMMPGMEMNQ